MRAAITRVSTIASHCLSAGSWDQELEPGHELVPWMGEMGILDSRLSACSPPWQSIELAS